MPRKAKTKLPTPEWLARKLIEQAGVEDSNVRGVIVPMWLFNYFVSCCGIYKSPYTSSIRIGYEATYFLLYGTGEGRRQEAAELFSYYSELATAHTVASVPVGKFRTVCERKIEETARMSMENLYAYLNEPMATLEPEDGGVVRQPLEDTLEMQRLRERYQRAMARMRGEPAREQGLNRSERWLNSIRSSLRPLSGGRFLRSTPRFSRRPNTRGL